MELISEKRGLQMMSTTKYHCESAGEGIEYASGGGVIKSRYRRIPLSQKKNLDHFRASFVSKERIRCFRRRARRYICCYYVLHNLHEHDDATGLNGNVKNRVKLEEIEKW